MKALYTIIVRAGKDRDAIRATLERFYPGWPINVKTLGGERSPEKAESMIQDLLGSKEHTILLFLGGREDQRIVERLAHIESERLAAVLVGKRRVRNARLEELHWYIEKARAKLRLRIGLASRHILVHRASDDQLYPGLVPDEPYADVFLATRGWVRWLNRLGCDTSGGDVILERLGGGEHLVLDSGKITCKLYIPDYGGKPYVNRLSEPEEKLYVDSMVAEKVSKFYEDLAISVLYDAFQRAEEALGGVDAVVVPWSGGKDSTIALYLAKIAFKDVIAVYVDTGVDFPHTWDYLQQTAENMNVELIRVKARVREELAAGREMPTHNNRWCTGLKLEALDSALRSLGDRILVVTGDRDAESESRSRRPPIRYEDRDTVKKVIVAPLKTWSTILVQIYAQLHGIKLNPLYDYGFYRLGCYICPALRSWEKMLLAREPLIASRLIGRPFYHRSLSQG